MSASRFVSVSAMRLPGRSGISSVRSSRIRTNAGGIAAWRDVEAAVRAGRRDADEGRAFDELARQRFSRSVIFETTSSAGAPTISRNCDSSLITRRAMATKGRLAGTGLSGHATGTGRSVP